MILSKKTIIATVRALLDKEAAYQLHLFIDNDSQIYTKRLWPYYQNLVKLKKSGKYDTKKAQKGLIPIIKMGGAKYKKDFGGDLKFDKQVQEAVAKELLRYFEDEYDLGNFD